MAHAPSLLCGTLMELFYTQSSTKVKKRRRDQNNNNNDATLLLDTKRLTMNRLVGRAA